MTRAEFDQFCKSLPATTHVVQWGGASVWKIGGKIFAIASAVADGDFQTISFKVSDLAYEILCEQEGIIPAPYLARAKWVQVNAAQGMNDDDIEAHLKDAHALIAAKLTKAMRKELGLI